MDTTPFTTPLDSELVDIVDLLADKKRSEAMDKINDFLFARASDVIDTYKQTVSSSYFDEPTAQQQPNEE